MENGGIFVNYRLCDGSGRPRDHALFVEILSHELADHFGTRKVFIDISRSTSDGYPDELRTKLSTCDVLLVVIHPEWLYDLQRRRDELVDGELDRVHYEISAALNGTLHSGNLSARRPEVIPILLEKTDPPKSVELPEDIRELALLQAFRLRFGYLTADLTRLLTELEVHTNTCWPPSPTPDPKTRNCSREIPSRVALRQRVSRGLIAAAFVTHFLIFMPEEQPEWTSATALLLWSALTIVGTLLGTVATTMFGRTIHRMEHHVHSLSALWLLTVRLGIVVMAEILFLPPLIAELDEETAYNLYVVGILANIILFFCFFGVTIRKIWEDSEWPPRVSAQPMELRRTIARLEHRLASLWHPPLSRIQREQAWMIVHQLDSAVAALRRMVDYTRTRQDWLRVGYPKLALGYTVWLTATLGLTVASMHEMFNQGHSPDWYLWVPMVGIVACVCGIGTMELMFRHDHRTLRWLIEEIEENRESRLLRHMPAHRTGRP
ncbi:MAG: hypothetical protein M3Q39_08300 [Actinomycetota bacterium]|nr:hypothetical protein [Actinomycetota bacterium]